MINSRATHGRGLICLTLMPERCQALGLTQMAEHNTEAHETAFTISIDAAAHFGVTTGISAADRAATIRVAIDPSTAPSDLRRPGHVFPLRARPGGVLQRVGQTEASIDLARLAGLYPAGVICEIMNADGTMARRPELERFAKRHKLVMLSVADLIRYRLQRDRLVRRIGSERMSHRGAGAFTAYTYQSSVDPSVHVALVKGDITGPEPVLTRVHRACLMGDALGSSVCECGQQLDQALHAIHEAGRGVIVYLRKEPSAKSALHCTHVVNEEVVPGHAEQTRV